jgi:hypothetical protein
MGVLLGMLGIKETDFEYMSKLGQQMIYDTINDYLGMHSREVDQLESFLVEGTTTDHTFGYKLPPFGYMERQGGQAQAAASKFGGKWEVSFPLEDYGKGLIKDDVTLAYMTPKELETHVDAVRGMDVATRRREILSIMFAKTDMPFDDRIFGRTLSVKSLANGDATLYPPVRGSMVEAIRDRFLVAGYLASAISNTNNPIVTARAALEKDFGRMTGGANIATFYNDTQVDKIKALGDFKSVEDVFVRSGQDTDVPVKLPQNLPGIIEGRCNGAWVVSWEWIPADYQLAVHLNAPRPVMRRIDPPAQRAALGLSAGLALVAEKKEAPLISAQYRNRYGYGVGNRLNGHIMQFKASGNYDPIAVG